MTLSAPRMLSFHDSYGVTTKVVMERSLILAISEIKRRVTTYAVTLEIDVGVDDVTCSSRVEFPCLLRRHDESRDGTVSNISGFRNKTSCHDFCRDTGN